MEVKHLFHVFPRNLQRAVRSVVYKCKHYINNDEHSPTKWGQHGTLQRLYRTHQSFKTDKFRFTCAVFRQSTSVCWSKRNEGIFAEQYGTSIYKYVTPQSSDYAFVSAAGVAVGSSDTDLVYGLKLYIVSSIWNISRPSIRLA